ncbi:MAG: hypothetical protein NW215_01995 [Hyphomicrobiales bacterium]|nr:hypothetical protein [Hyphomicrobiales bacterium]
MTAARRWRGWAAALTGAALCACSYIPKPESSVDASGTEVKSTATVKTTTIRRPLE